MVRVVNLISVMCARKGEVLGSRYLFTQEEIVDLSRVVRHA